MRESQLLPPYDYDEDRDDWWDDQYDPDDYDEDDFDWDEDFEIEWEYEQ